MREYKRHLPHQVPKGVPIFLTWNLKGAMPDRVAQWLHQERKRLQQEARRANELPRDRSLRHHKLLFAKADVFLDHSVEGPLHLRDPRCAKIVEDSILFGATERYALFSWCVMANHVHMLLTPVWELQDVTRGIKGFTARKINQMHNAVGRTFWQDESYDHWVRDEEELLRIIYYIENNPVKAGLCASSEEWPWSSARFRTNWPVGQAFLPDTPR